ncbi:MAG: hypothetical protein R2710_12835 [Acidimicrobiales bacterium]
MIDANLSRDGKLLAVARAVLAADREGPAWNVRSAPDFPDPESIEREQWPDPKMIRSRYDTRYVVGGFPRCVVRWPRCRDGSDRPTTPLSISPCSSRQRATPGRPTADARWPEPDGDHDRSHRAPVRHARDAVRRLGRDDQPGNHLGRRLWIDSETEAWTPDGRLLAQARQLMACTP